MGWAFFIDQIIPLIITVAFTFFFLRRCNLNNVKATLKKHFWILLLTFTSAIIVHLGVLSYFFWAEEVSFILKPITQNDPFRFHLAGSASMRGYFASSYTFLYLVFGTKAWIYPLFSIIYFAISTQFVYWFIFLLTNKKSIAGFAALFFATTPSFLDMFTFHTTAHAPTLITGLISFIFLLYYRRHYQKRDIFKYYILSIMFFFVTIKLGFIRSAGYTFIPLLLLLLPLNNLVKIRPASVIIHYLPYIIITTSFVLLEFLHIELINLLRETIKSSSLDPVLNYIIGYRGVDSSLTFTKILYFFTHLFIPSGLVAKLFPFFHQTFPGVSLVLSLGIIILLCILFALFITFKFKRKQATWLIIFALFFIFLNLLHNAIGYQAPDYFNPQKNQFAELFDREFSQESSGYGPGSRYIYSSAVGVSMLFALFVFWLTKKGKVSAFFATLFCIFVFAGNTYFTIRAQINNFEGMNKYKSLVENIFKIVPRDKQPKLLFSANPESNGLDRKFGGWEWIHGFYNENELYYSTSPQEIRHYIQTAGYKKENLYAFSHNPQTLTFKDISEEARDYFFRFSSSNQQTPTNFSQLINKPLEYKMNDLNTTIVERIAIESPELNKRTISEQLLSLVFRIRKTEPPLPFTDAIFRDKELNLIPKKLWEKLKPSPLIFSRPEDLKQKINETSEGNLIKVLTIIQESRKLSEGTETEVSDKAYRNSSTASLFDGLYTTFPVPTSQEKYFIAGENPVRITITFPFPAGVKRILLNTPQIYTSSQYPKKISVFSLQNSKFDKIETFENLIPEKWSPNKGAMIKIDLPETIFTSSLQLEITGSKPIVLDEIALEDENSSYFSPQQINQINETAYRFVTFDVYHKLRSIKSFDYLSVIWACAEDFDWNKQITEKEEITPGVWHEAKINIPTFDTEVQTNTAINCYGSPLRKIYLIGPPYPVQLEITKAYFE